MSDEMDDALVARIKALATKLMEAIDEEERSTEDIAEAKAVVASALSITYGSVVASFSANVGRARRGAKIAGDQIFEHARDNIRQREEREKATHH